MAYSHLGFSYSSRPQFLMTSGSLGSCLEPGGRALADTFPSPSHPALGCPVYESRVLRSPPAPGIGICSGPSPKGQRYYNTCSGDAPAFYSRSPLDSREGALPAHMASSQGPAYYPYEYPFGQYPYDRYRYSCTDASRRKNATRETTSTLKAWLQEHQKNPYPTKGEKIMLAIITRMTLTQVSTWFANARRRLKKENKVTWSPRALKTSEDLGCGDDSDGEEEPIKSEKEPSDQSGDLQSDLEDFDRLDSDGSHNGPKTHFVLEDCGRTTHLAELSHSRQPVAGRSDKDGIPSDCPKRTAAQRNGSSFYPLVDLPALDLPSEARLKIWSITRQAASLQPEYPPCMLAYPSTPGCPASVTGLTSSDAKPSRRRDSPVATLRDWVDGVFHDGRFQQSASNQAAVWEGLIDGQLDCKAEGRSY